MNIGFYFLQVLPCNFASGGDAVVKEVPDRAKTRSRKAAGTRVEPSPKALEPAISWSALADLTADEEGGPAGRSLPLS